MGVGPGDGGSARLYGLAQSLQRWALEFGQLFQEQDAEVLAGALRNLGVNP